MRQFTRTIFKGMWLEHRKTGLEGFHKDTIFIKITVDTWPLVLDPDVSEPFGTLSLRGVCGGQIERRGYTAFAKKHPTIHIAEYWVNDCPLRCNEVLMLSFKGRWAMRTELGRDIFPDLHKATVARSIQADFVEFDRRTYENGRHLAFIIMSNGIDRILVVMAIQRGAWLLLLAKIGSDVSVRTVRQDLLSPVEKQDGKDRGPPGEQVRCLYPHGDNPNSSAWACLLTHLGHSKPAWAGTLSLLSERPVWTARKSCSSALQSA